MSNHYRFFSIIHSLLIISILILSNTTIPLFLITTGEEVYNETDEAVSRGSRVDKPTGTGPYSTTYVTEAIPRTGDTDVPARIYYPTSGGGNVASSGAPFNGIVFAPGAGGTETSYSGWLSQIASWGFIVTIVGTGGPCNQEVVDIQSYVVDYYEALNANSSSIFYNKINASACGGSGHSNGGWTSIAGAVADSRFAGICTLAAAAGPYFDSGQANTANLHVPLQLVAGADDTTYLPSSNAYYQLANPIKSYIKVIGSGHGGPFNFEYLVSFFKFWLNEKKEYGTFIYGDELQKDIDDGEIEFTSDIGLNIDPDISKTVVIEDEEITFTPGGRVVSPNPPDRTITKYQWDFQSDGDYDWQSTITNTTTYAYKQNGEYTVRYKMEDSWGLTASMDYTITVNNMAPIIEAGSDMTVDEDELINFDASDSNDTESDVDTLLYKWEFGDGNETSWYYLPTASYSYEKMGEYTVKAYVKDDDDATGIDSFTVKVKNVVPVANFTANRTTVQIKQPISFDAVKTYDTSSDIFNLDFKWNFGDLDTAEGISIEHFYDDEGKYTVTLTVSDDDDAVSKKSIVISVLNSPPRCEAMDDIIVNEDDIVIFSGTGSDSTGDFNDLEFSWNLSVPGVPDSPWASTADYGYQYTKAGVYNAVLSVRDDDGAIGTDTVTITVRNVEPTADFSVSSKGLLEDEIITFNADESTDTESDLETLNYTWYFGDGGSAHFGKIVTYSFSDADFYKIRLTVTDDDSEEDMVLRTIEIRNVEPTAEILTSHIEAETGTTIFFSADQVVDTSSDLDSLKFIWDFGDNGSATGKEVNHSYTDPGWYMVTLRVIDDDEESSSSELWVNIIEEEEQQDVEGKKEVEEEPNLAIYGIIIAVLLIVLVLMLVLMMKKKPKKPEAYVRPEVEQPAGFIPPQPGYPDYEQYPPTYDVDYTAAAYYDQTAVQQQLPDPALPFPEQAQVVEDQSQAAEISDDSQRVKEDFNQ